MKSGVDHYTTGTAVVDIHFPGDDVVCKHCWLFLRSDPELRRYRCRLTGEPIPEPQHSTGQQCPLIFEGGEAHA